MFIWKFIKKIFDKRNNINQILYKNSTTKHVINASCNLKLSTQTEALKAKINAEVKAIVIKYINNPEELIKFAQNKGVKVYRIKNADKWLKKIGEEEGLLTPLKGIKALIINLAASISGDEKINVSLKSREMMIFDSAELEIYTIARALYKYYSYKNNMPGYDYKTQEIFKNIYNSAGKSSNPLSKCTIKDMYACKEAISRDLESINFTAEISREYENAKKVLKQIQLSQSATV